MIPTQAIASLLLFLLKHSFSTPSVTRILAEGVPADNEALCVPQQLQAAMGSPHPPASKLGPI